MYGKPYQKKIKFLLLIIAAILISSCRTVPEIAPLKIIYSRPVLKDYPDLVWYDVPSVYIDLAIFLDYPDEQIDFLIDFFEKTPGYYGLNDVSTDFDDLQEHFDNYDGLKIKINDILTLYENGEN